MRKVDVVNAVFGPFQVLTKLQRPVLQVRPQQI